MRKDKLIKERGHDPYEEGRKYPEGTYCPECKAVYHDGRWVWPEGDLPSGEPHLCPACRRIRDDYPAGELILSGSYLPEHREEIINLIKNITTEEERRSPLKRIMAMEESDNAMRITFTDDHLARRVGEALHRAHKGDLEIKYSEESRFLRVFWHREGP